MTFIDVADSGTNIPISSSSSSSSFVDTNRNNEGNAYNDIDMILQQYEPFTINELEHAKSILIQTHTEELVFNLEKKCHLIFAQDIVGFLSSSCCCCCVFVVFSLLLLSLLLTSFDILDRIR
jgi:hypothetical protein